MQEGMEDFIFLGLEMIFSEKTCIFIFFSSGLLYYFHLLREVTE